VLPRKKDEAAPLRPCFALLLLEDASFSTSLSWVGDKDGACFSRRGPGDALPLCPLALWQLLGAAKVLLARESEGRGTLLLPLDELLRVVPKPSEQAVLGVGGSEASRSVSDISRDAVRLRCCDVPLSSLANPVEPAIHSAAAP
jgi:hypothetical protein